MSETAVSNPLDPMVEVKPSTITITNFDVLEKQVNQYAKKYKGYVATEETIKDDKNLRADLKKTVKLLDEKRKEVKRGYNKPLDAFEQQIKGLEATIKTVIDPIDDGIKDLEQKEREARRIEVQKIIDEMAPKYKIDAKEIEMDSKWLNKSISNKQLLDGIGGAMHDIKSAKDKLDGDIKAITEYCAAMNIDSGGYVDQIKAGDLLQDVMQRANKHKLELESKAEQERKQEAAADAVAAVSQNTVQNKTVDTETGEVVKETVDVFAVQFEVTGTNAALDGLGRYLKDNGSDLKVRLVQPREKVGVQDATL